MLAFFRKYQTYFFAVITVVIIISFSFFGTYSTLSSNTTQEPTAFKAIDGTEVPRSELDELVLFIGTDNEEKRLFGGIWGPNFLNDGVIRNDFLGSGLAEILVSAYPEMVERDLQPRLEKEKHFTLYTHPQAKFLSLEGAWSYFSPEMKQHWEGLRSAEKSTSDDAFAARVALFLAEKKFPAPLARQVLRYQEKQYNWLRPDPNLDRIDLSLFGYHTLDDWFGPRFLRLVGEFIINSSKIAEQKGYQVSKAEALTELLRNAEISFQQNRNNPNIGVANSTEYFYEQLRRLGMDQNKASKVWRHVLLFRRLFQDMGNAVMIDPLTHKGLYEYATESVEGDLYRLSPEFRFANYRTLQKFQIYLESVSKQDKSDMLLPSSFLTIGEIRKKNPELLQKRYLLQVAEIKKESLQSKVGLKEMWNWEVEDSNWAKLKSAFPELGIKKGNTREERFAALDSLDDRTRTRVDALARASYVDAHPEWLKQALQEAETKQAVYGIRPQKGKTIFGLENREELIRLLDEAPLPTEIAISDSALEVIEKLSNFEGGNSTLYRISVIDRAPQEEILTFAEADSAGVLDELLDRQLENFYLKIRETKPQEFQKEDSSWKPFADVKDRIADFYFEKIIANIRNSYTTAHPGQQQKLTTPDLVASFRFYAYAQDVKSKIMQGAIDSSFLLRSPSTPLESLHERPLLTDQWKLIKINYQTTRGDDAQEIDAKELFAISDKEWTEIHTPVNGDLYFFQLTKKKSNTEVAAMFDKLQEAHQMLSNDAQRTYMHRILRDLKDKNALSLDYLEPRVEPVEIK